MKQVEPEEIKVGDYYLQVFQSDNDADNYHTYLKVKTPDNPSNPTDFYGRVIRVIDSGDLEYSKRRIGVIGKVRISKERRHTKKFYLLTEKERIAYLI